MSVAKEEWMPEDVDATTAFLRIHDDFVEVVGFNMHRLCLCQCKADSRAIADTGQRRRSFRGGRQSRAEN